jgi:hypothetical protein
MLPTNHARISRPMADIIRAAVVGFFSDLTESQILQWGQTFARARMGSAQYRQILFFNSLFMGYGNQGGAVAEVTVNL